MHDMIAKAATLDHPETPKNAGIDVKGHHRMSTLAAITSPTEGKVIESNEITYPTDLILEIN